MAFKVKLEGKSATLTTDYGKLDANNAQELKEVLHELHKTGNQSLVINLAVTKYCDSSGLSALLMTHRISKEVGGTFVLCCLMPNVLKMIQIAQLDRVFKIVDTEAEALTMLA